MVTTTTTSAALRLALALLTCAGGASAATADYVLSFAQADVKWARTEDVLQVAVVGKNGATKRRSFTPTDAVGATFDLKFSDVNVGDVTAVQFRNPKKNAYCFVDLQVTVDGKRFVNACEGKKKMVCVSGETGDCKYFPGAALCRDDGRFLSVPVSDCVVDFVVSFAQADVRWAYSPETRLDLVVVGELGETKPAVFDPADGKGAVTQVAFKDFGVGAVTGVKVRNPDPEVYCFVDVAVAEDGAVTYKNCAKDVACVGKRPPGWCAKHFPTVNLCVDDGTYASVGVSPAASCGATWTATARWMQGAAQAAAAAHPAPAGFAAGVVLAAVALAVRGCLGAPRNADAGYKPLV